jgi:hypothetical protein
LVRRAKGYGRTIHRIKVIRDGNELIEPVERGIMGAPSEVIEEPLTSQALAVRYRQLCADPLLENIPGKIELDVLGRILMSPASNYHGMLQSKLSQLLAPLGGRAIAEASVVTESGVPVFPRPRTLHRDRITFEFPKSPARED